MKIKNKIINLFCLHKNGEVVCWHYYKPWFNSYYTTLIEVQLRCNKCNKYYFRYVYPENFEEFVSKNKDKQWSDTCKPVID